MPRKVQGRHLSRKAKGRSSFPADQFADSTEDCLCLTCRQVGHVVQSCPQLPKENLQGIKVPAETEGARLSHAFNLPFPTVEGSLESLCQRCSELEVGFSTLAGARLVGNNAGHIQQAVIRRTPIASLGPLRTLQLFSTCPLCRLIFDITYLSEDDLTKPMNASGAHLVLYAMWTLMHLISDIQPPKEEWGPHTICAYTQVTREREIFHPDFRVRAGVDAIAIVDTGESGGKDAPALGVKAVNPRVVDYSMLKDWLRRCDDLHHITCRPPMSDDLQKIKLVDVETREIVMYPPDGCDYIALSYVWGGVEQPGYKLGDKLPTSIVPATLEDAMVVTRQLGKRYLWADSLCINQGNKEEKNVQIPLMSAIYTSAWATIFSVAGRSARSGFPRVGTLEGVISQLSCELEGKQLLSVMPTLTEQISRSFWATRAWTFQEGLLSPRRLFFTNHQVYFECNVAQCCESLDDSKSPFHLLSDAERISALRKGLHGGLAKIVNSDVGWAVGGGVLRDPFRPIHVSKKWRINDSLRKWQYEELVQRYTTKKMTNDDDALNAFSAVLTRFKETTYKSGFVHGLPVEDLPTALLWTHAARPRRRDGFPTWSWVGWEGVVTGAAHLDVPGITGDDQGLVHVAPLRVWGSQDGHPELVYDINPILDKGELSEEEDVDDDDALDVTIDQEEGSSPAQSDDDGQDLDEDDSTDDGSDSWEDASYDADLEDPERDPVLGFAKTMLEDVPAVPNDIDRNELLIQGIVIRLTFRRDPRSGYRGVGAQCRVRLGGGWKHQLIFQGHNALELIEERHGKEQEFLLVRRELFQYALILLDWDGGTASRAGVASLEILDIRSFAYTKPEIKLFTLR